MTKKNIVTEDRRVKDLFRKIPTDKPADDFTMRIMQKITAENLVIEKKTRPLFILRYSGIGVMALALFVFLLPRLAQWIDYLTNVTFPAYAQVAKDILSQILVSVTSVYISPVVLIICASCSLLFTLLIITNSRQTLNEKK